MKFSIALFSILTSTSSLIGCKTNERVKNASQIDAANAEAEPLRLVIEQEKWLFPNQLCENDQVVQHALTLSSGPQVACTKVSFVPPDGKKLAISSSNQHWIPFGANCSDGEVVNKINVLAKQISCAKLLMQKPALAEAASAIGFGVKLSPFRWTKYAERCADDEVVVKYNVVSEQAACARIVVFILPQ